MKLLVGVASLILLWSCGATGDQSVSVTSDSEMKIKTTEIVSPIANCRPGFVSFKTECIRSEVQTDEVEVSYKCAENFQMTIDQKCISKQEHCDVGYGFDGYRCAPLILAPNHGSSELCPRGYLFSSSSTCTLIPIPTNYLHPTPTCPEEYLLEAGECVRRKTVMFKEAPVGAPFCPSEYTMVRGACQRQIERPDEVRQLVSQAAPKNIVFEIEKTIRSEITNDFKMPINLENLNDNTMPIDLYKLLESTSNGNSAVNENAETRGKCDHVAPRRVCHPRTRQCYQKRICPPEDQPRVPYYY